MAEAGDVQSCFKLGQIFAIGEGAEQNDTAAFDWYLKAAKGGNVLAALVIGTCYNNGIVVGQDADEAAMWYLRAVRKGNLDAYQALLDYYKVHDTPSDEGVFEYFLKKSEDDADAAYILGRLYELGVGTDFDPVKAYEAYRKSESMGDLDGACQSAVCVLNGTGVKRDRAEGARLLQELVDKKFAPAYLALAKCYEYGFGVERDQKRTFALYDEAVALGSVDAMYHLGRCYMDGIGVDKDGNYSSSWYAAAALRGSRDGLYGMARCYLGGVGEDKNKD